MTYRNIHFSQSNNYLSHVFNTKTEVQELSQYSYCAFIGWYNDVQYNQVNINSRPAIVGWICGVNSCP